MKRMRLLLVVVFLIVAVLGMTYESRANYVNVTDNFSGIGTLETDSSLNLQGQDITTNQNVIIIGSDTYSGDTTAPNLSWLVNGSYYDMSGNLLGTFSMPNPNPSYTYTNATNYEMSSVELLGWSEDTPNYIQTYVSRTSNSGEVEYISTSGDVNLRDNNDLYLQSTTLIFTPIPAAAWLFGSVLLGLVGIHMKLQNNKNVQRTAVNSNRRN
jgi:hypothetical protein